MGSVQDFLKQANSDLGIRKELATATTPEQVVAIANNHGYTFDMNEMKEELGHLPDEQLEGVAGAGGALRGVSLATLVPKLAVGNLSGKTVTTGTADGTKKSYIDTSGGG